MAKPSVTHRQESGIAQHDSDSSAEDSDGTIDSMDSIEDDQNVNALYRGLVSRKVDLVGDYAGNELFLIDGDSLLLRCFEDQKLDFQHGLQLLHAVYNVEAFLENLIKRKCNFNVVFFDSNDALCVPETAAPTSISKYLLARAAIIRHLGEALRQDYPHISVKTYEAWYSESFVTDLRDSPPYFVMAHDGARASSIQTHIAQEENTSTQSPASLAFRKMILFFIGRNISVALVNELQWQDTKVVTEVLEARSRELIKHGLDTIVHKCQDQKAHTFEYIHKLQDLSDQFSERQLLAITVVAILLQGPPSEISDLECISFCSRFLLHQALLVGLPLSSRRVNKISTDPLAQQFLSRISSTAAGVLRDSSWQTIAIGKPGPCDIADFVDGRLFLFLGEHEMQLNEESSTVLEDMQSAVTCLTGSGHLWQTKPPRNEHLGVNGNGEKQNQLTVVDNFAVLPFSNSVFDTHLKSVHIKTDATRQEQSLGSQKIFKELTHWHNSKALIARKGQAPDPKTAFYAARRNQRYMAEMLRYAASLTNAVGKILEPQTIFVQSGSFVQAAPSASQSRATGIVPSRKEKVSALKSKPEVNKSGGAKASTINASKQAMLDRIAIDSAKKAETTGQKRFDSWREVLRALGTSDPLTRYSKTQTYLNSLRKEDKTLLGAEVELHMGNCLVEYWIEVCSAEKQSQHMHVAAAIWNHMRAISLYPTITRSILKALNLIVDALNLPSVAEPAEDPAKRNLTFPLSLPNTADLSVRISPKVFLLLHCGPYLERSFNSAPDGRVDFEPDDWQKKVLDSIDANQSIFVVAPTSAGKTFISFYAMRKVLEADDDGVLIYVAPTKALVNQIAAEIQARYSKNFKHGGKSVWAIHTRDHRVNNATGCQVLVTVPHVLQIMLLAPSHARSWSQRVKRIIFDEIHTIGQADDGVVWEQLLLMSPCPIIGLSATVGNPNDFSQWLASTQEAVGNKLITVQHPHRYSDLRKYYHIPPKQFSFTGLPEPVRLSGLGLDGSPSLHHIHPVAALVEKSRGIPEDLSLEPRDCYLLWQAMTQVATERFRVPEDLSPEVALPDAARKTDILEWERALKSLLQQWLGDPISPYDNLLELIERSFRDGTQEETYVTSASQPSTSIKHHTTANSDDYVKTSLSLLCRLHERGALPAIFFNYDRLKCEEHAQDILKQLKSAEDKQKKSGPKWEKELKRWEEWKLWKEKQRATATKSRGAKPSKKAKGDHDDSDKVSKDDLQRDSASKEDDKWEWFDPEAPMPEYSFADYSKLQQSELDDYIRRLRYQDVEPWLVDALKRGVGVHHAGMPRSYRTCVEVLFRKQFLRVIIATGTLALGINMPCKTVVFSGDSVYLTALNYRQCAGRAGRRGFDLLGNVVFHGVSREKVCRLISSRLPDLNGHFPITTSLVLRLFTLMHDSSYSSYAVQAVNSLLSQPRLYMGGESFKDQTMHHLRFSIEYLRRQNLLSSDGAPLNFAGLVSHLYYTENSSFAFHALLKEGYFNDLCARIDEDEDDTLLTLMLVMSHLFLRRLCRQSVIETKAKSAKPLSSVIFLPDLPAKAAEILENHNRETLKVYQTYVKTFIEQHIKDADDALPLSGMKFGGSSVPIEDETPTAPNIRSSFVALSGHSDIFTSIHDLCATVRSGVFLEEAVIPYMPSSDEVEAPINAWLYDFYRHGDTQALQDANGVRKADVWFLLNDFSLVLATIVTSLGNFLKIEGGADLDIMDIQASGDKFEEAQEDKVGEKEESAETTSAPAGSNTTVAPQKQQTTKKTKKAKVLDSWDDEDEDQEEMAQQNGDRENGSGGSNTVDGLADAMNAWDIEKDGGLLNVLKAFQKLRVNFDTKFKAMWA